MRRLRWSLAPCVDLFAAPATGARRLERVCALAVALAFGGEIEFPQSASLVLKFPGDFAHMTQAWLVAQQWSRYGFPVVQ